MELDTSDLVDEKATVKLSRPVPPVPPAKQAAAPAAPEPKQAEPEGKTEEPEEKVAEPEEKTEEPAAAAAASADTVEKKKVKPPRVDLPVDSRPSLAYLVMAAITLILLIGTATLTTVQYLNLCQDQNIELPGLGK